MAPSTSIPISITIVAPFAHSFTALFAIPSVQQFEKLSELGNGRFVQRFPQIPWAVREIRLSPGLARLRDLGGARPRRFSSIPAISGRGLARRLVLR
jgi:hypothetical protein